ncbi:hypothetical protein RFI_10029, partial [Reticulomyxa filosa]
MFKCQELREKKKGATDQRTKRKSNEVKIIRHWVRTLDINLEWANDLDKIILQYVSVYVYMCICILLLFQTLPNITNKSKMQTKYKSWKILKEHKATIRSVKFSPDGGYIISAADDKTVRIWDLESKQQLRHFEAKCFSNIAIFSPNGDTVALGALYGSIELWDVNSGRQLLDMDFSSDGKKILISYNDGAIRIWSVDSGQIIQQLPGHQSTVSSIQFSPDDQMIVSSSHDRTIVLWDVESGEKLKELKGHSGTVMCARFSPDGQFI